MTNEKGGSPEARSVSSAAAKPAGRALAIAAALVLAGCSREANAPEWRHVCVESHTEIRLMTTMIPNGNGGMRTQVLPQSVRVCDRRELMCVTPDESQQCQPLDLTGEGEAPQ